MSRNKTTDFGRQLLRSCPGKFSRLSGKLAVILHADIAASTALVQQDEQLAHERIQDAFRRFSETIEKYQGHILELRGDALLAHFERASDAVTATLSFQADHTYLISRLKDDLRPTIREGIAMGEVVKADDTVTGSGVVLAQRVEQLADPGGVCITCSCWNVRPGPMFHVCSDSFHIGQGCYS